MLKTVSNVLDSQIPELKFFDNYLEEVSKGEVHSTMYFDGCPDRTSADTLNRNYYTIYYGEDHPDHTVRTYTFYVNVNLKWVLVDTEDEEGVQPLSIVKKSKDWKEDWDVRRKDLLEKRPKKDHK